MTGFYKTQHLLFIFAFVKIADCIMGGNCMFKLFVSLYFIIGALTALTGLTMVNLLVKDNLEGLTLDEIIENENFSYETEMGLKACLDYPWLIFAIVILIWPYLWSQVGIHNWIILITQCLTKWNKR